MVSQTQLLVFIATSLHWAFLHQLVAGQGFECIGRVYFQAEHMERAAIPNLVFYSQERVDNITQCAKQCYRKEFCRFAMFTPDKDGRTGTCEYSYSFASGRCADGNATQTLEVKSATGVFCIRCDEGYRVSSLPPEETTARPLPATFEGILVNILKPAPSASQSCLHRQKVLVGGTVLTNRTAPDLDACKCLCAQTWTSSFDRDQCRSLTFHQERKLCILDNQSQLNDSTQLISYFGDDTIYFDFNCPNNDPRTFLFENCTISFSFLVQPTSEEPCFSSVDGFLLSHSVMAIEDQISRQDCKCLCAGSAQIFRHRDGFECKSMMYYPKDHVCILNSASRVDRSDLFRQDFTDSATTYYELKCAGDSTIDDYIANECPNLAQLGAELLARTTVTGIVESTTTPTTVTPRITKATTTPIVFLEDDVAALPAPGRNSDGCFTEARRYVLQTSDIAPVKEGGITLRQCKCLCLHSQKTTGFKCQSIQFYYDLGDCVLNGDSHVTKPKKFALATDDSFVNA